MFVKVATGLSLQDDGSIRLVELAATWRHLTLRRAATYAGEGEGLLDQWSSAIGRARDDGFSFGGLVLGLPFSMTFRRTLTFPFQGRRKISQVLPLELEGEIPLSPEDIVADFLPAGAGREGSSGIAFAAGRGDIQSLLALLPGEINPVAIQTNEVGLVSSAGYSGITSGTVLACDDQGASVLECRDGTAAHLRRIKVPADRQLAADRLAEAVAEGADQGGKVIIACAGLLEPLLSALNERGVTGVLTVSDLAIFREAESPVAGDAGEFLPAFGLALRGIGRKEAPPFDLRQGPFRPLSPLLTLRAPLIRALAFPEASLRSSCTQAHCSRMLAISQEKPLMPARLAALRKVVS